MSQSVRVYFLRNVDATAPMAPRVAQKAHSRRLHGRFFPGSTNGPIKKANRAHSAVGHMAHIVHRLPSMCLSPVFIKKKKLSSISVEQPPLCTTTLDYLLGICKVLLDYTPTSDQRPSFEQRQGQTSSCCTKSITLILIPFTILFPPSWYGAAHDFHRGAVRYTVVGKCKSPKKFKAKAGIDLGHVVGPQIEVRIICHMLIGPGQHCRHEHPHHTLGRLRGEGCGIIKQSKKKNKRRQSTKIPNPYLCLAIQALRTCTLAKDSQSNLDFCPILSRVRIQRMTISSFSLSLSVCSV